MSHFAVLCVGNVSRNMARFDEQDEDYFTHYDRLEYLKECYDEHKKENQSFYDFCVYWWSLSDDEIVKEGSSLPDRYCIVVNGQNEVVGAYNWSNNDSFYDYYGKGYDAFILKDGTKTSSAIKRDIDFDAMKKENDEKNLENYDSMIKLLGGEIPSVNHTWKSLISRVDSNEITIEEARRIYNSQDSVKKYEKATEGKWLGWDASVEDYCCTREEYLKKNQLCLSYGFVKDEEYYSRGNMGWWGISSDNCPLEEWSDKLWELIESVDDDELLTMLDCHV